MRMRAIAALIVSTASVVAVTATPARAAAITVTTTADGAIDGLCSLREAVAAANTDTAVDSCNAGSSADTITLPAGMYPIGAPLVLTSDVTLSGAGSSSTILDAAGRSASAGAGV